MVKLNSSSVFMKDPVDVWGKEKTIGLAEHAVRTHAPPSPYDRRGTLIYWDDFESPSTRYYPEIKVASGGTVARSITNPKFGDFCLKLTTGATTDDWARAYYTVNDFHVGKIGAQFSLATQATNALARLSMEYYDGAKVWTATLEYDLLTDILRYYGDDGTYHSIDTIPYYKGAAGELIPYSTIKLVADFDAKKYTRSLLFGEEDDLSAYDLRSDNMIVDPGIVITFSLSTSTNIAYTAYLDNFRLTENEPA